MLSFSGHTFLEARYFLGQWIPGNTATVIETLVVLAIVGCWLYAFSNMVADRRSGVIVALMLSIVLALINYSSIPYGWPLLEISVWIMLVSNVLVASTILVRLVNKPH